jgi:hypothetical protein
VAFTPEQRAMLERQVAYFRDDERIRERAEPWRTATPEECLEATAAQCDEAVAFLAMLDDDGQERALKPEPLPADTLAILEALH